MNAQKQIGLTITSNGIMIPRKSVVAIIGISNTRINKSKKEKSCENCKNYRNCTYRKGANSCGNKTISENNILIFDGAMGTMLQQKGLKLGENPEVFGLQNPDKLIEIHTAYLEAGSNVILQILLDVMN